MTPLLTIAGLTVREATRRRLLLAVVVLTLVLIALTGWGYTRLSQSLDQSLRTGGMTHLEVTLSLTATVILITYMGSIILAIGSAFLSAPAIASDVESGILLAMLPRPIRRSDVVLGKWLGLSCLVAVYTIGAGSLELWVIRLVTGWWAPHPWLVVGALAAQSIVLLTLALLISTRLAPLTGGIIAVGLFGLCWIAGIVQQVGAALGNHGLVTAGTAIGLVLPTDGFWRTAIYNLEPAILLAAGDRWFKGNPFGVAAPPPLPFYLWAAAWLGVVLGVAIWSFNRRDL